MRFLSLQKFSVVALVCALPSSVYADFTYQETTQITGGSMLGMLKMAGAFSSQARKAGDPVVSTVYLRGNQLARISNDGIDIYDLDKETITHADTVKKTYTVVTFQQLKDQIAKAEAEAEKKQPAKAPEPAAPAKNDDVKMSYDVHVRNTGVEKQVSGLAAKEAILTMTMTATDTSKPADPKNPNSGTMAVTNDMWLVPEIPGYGQVQDFYVRMAAKMGTLPTVGGGMDFSRMMAQRPGATEAMAGMAKEMEKIQGVPVMQVMRMGTTLDGKPLPAASEAPLPPDNTPPPPSGGDIAKQSAASVLTSHFGLGGFGKKKQADPPPANGKDANTPTNAVLMESQSSTTNFSSAPVDTSHFEVPAGFKLVSK